MSQLSFMDAFDICTRSRGHENSRAANSRVASSKALVRERVRIFVGACDFHGATLKETAATMQHPEQHRSYYPNELSGRFTELKAAGEIFDSGRTRDGCTVYVARLEWARPA